LNYRELTRKSRRLGCEFDRMAKGDHEIWINTANRGRTTIPNWRGKDLKAGTIGGILRDLDISRHEFDQS